MTRNPGTSLHVDWLSGLLTDLAAVRDRALALDTSSRAWRDDVERLVLAVRLLDLTTLTDADTVDSVRDLCALALRPLPRELSEAAGVEQGAGGVAPRVAAVCVFDRFVEVARAALGDEHVRVAAVTAGFPRAHTDLERRLEEVRATVAAGAHEIDVVITREHALRHDWAALHAEVSALRDACGPALLKVILAAGDLGPLDTVAGAGLVCCMAGADFIKTSTGREEVNATLPIGLAMSAAIRRYRERSGHAVGLKAAGGIRSPHQALAWLRLAEEETDGCAPPTPACLRIGASSLLGALRARLSELRATH